MEEADGNVSRCSYVAIVRLCVFVEGTMDGGMCRDPMRRKWEQFAKTNPFAYIMTGLAHEGEQAFWQSGETTVRDEIIPLLEEEKIRRDIGLEIGCGVGRLTLPLSRVFNQVIGVDVSEGMVSRAVSFAAERGITNARFVAVAGPNELLDVIPEAIGQVTFVYSLLVFQHIQDFKIIEGYLAAIKCLLSRDGIAYVQFDTRPRTLAYHVKTAMPDFLLPWFWRRGVRRIRRSPCEIKSALDRNGLHIVREFAPATAYHRYVVRP